MADRTFFKGAGSYGLPPSPGALIIVWFVSWTVKSWLFLTKFLIRSDWHQTNHLKLQMMVILRYSVWSSTDVGVWRWFVYMWAKRSCLREQRITNRIPAATQIINRKILILFCAWFTNKNDVMAECSGGALNKCCEPSFSLRPISHWFHHDG